MRLVGRVGMSLVRDQNGFRTYEITHHVIGQAGEYAALALQCPGLPLPGERWFIGSDLDIWVWCRADARVTLLNPREPIPHFTVQQTFSNKPPERGKAPQARLCQDQQIQDPLLEPQKIGGSFVTSKVQPDYDRFGEPIRNSAWQKISGPNNEFDVSRPQITIEQNVALLELGLLYNMMDTVNDQPLWGCPARSIKFRPAHFERVPYGQCGLYYKRTLEFDVNIRISETISSQFPDGIPVSGWDKDFLDQGDAVLMGDFAYGTGLLSRVPFGWNAVPGADPGNPAHFRRYLGPEGNPTSVILDGAGKPWFPRPTTTNGCAQCPTGAPMTWRVHGYQDAADDSLQWTALPDIEMTYLGGCAWSGSLTSQGITFNASLSFNAPNWNLSLTSSTSGLFSPQWSYQLISSSFSCSGGNVMPFLAGPIFAPPSLTISPVGTNQPGQKHVEYYDESNFLLLGIPVLF